MNVLRPARFPGASLWSQFQWQKCQGGLNLESHLLSVGSSFPSVLLAYSAQAGMNSAGRKVAEELTHLGLNAFLSTAPAPLAALSQALVQRKMPLGLYVSETPDQLLNILALGPHGGPVDLEAQPASNVLRRQRTGVIGEAEISESYLQQLAGLIDQFPEPGMRLSEVRSPFQGIQQSMERSESFRILEERDPHGPVATIGPDGQSLTLDWPDGRTCSTANIVQIIGKYLVGVRCSSGSILGPAGTAELVRDWGAATVISGDALDMSHQAIFSDLLLGWWEPGIIAHQGHSPFGDAFLSLAYFLEAYGNLDPKDLL